MNVTDVIGYAEDGAIYCVNCFDGDPDAEDVGALFAGAEFDCAEPTCDGCGEVFEDVSVIHYGDPCRVCGHRERCDQCEACMINGVYCHETGCPNTNKVYDSDEDRWISVYEEDNA